MGAELVDEIRGARTRIAVAHFVALQRRRSFPQIKGPDAPLPFHSPRNARRHNGPPARLCKVQRQLISRINLDKALPCRPETVMPNLVPTPQSRPEEP